MLQLLLAVALLATRVVPLEHAHVSGSEPSDHGSRRHVHTHGHDHGHTHEALHADEERHDDVEQDVNHGHVSTPHDEDALYLDDVLATRATERGDASLVMLDLHVMAWAVSFPLIGLPPPKAVAEPPPDSLPVSLPLYLRNLSLRI